MTPRPSGHYWAACGRPIRSSTKKKKTNTRGREETRSGTKKLCFHNLFYTIVPCTSMFCISPAPRTAPKVASKGARDCAVVRALASHQCVPGSTPGVDTICGLSLLLVLLFVVLPRESFLRVLRFSLLLKNQHFQIPIRSETHGHV